jgi:hypothetical protein
MAAARRRVRDGACKQPNIQHECDSTDLLQLAHQPELMIVGCARGEA